MVHLASISAALAVLPFISAHPSEILNRQDRGGCGTEVTPEDLAAIAEVATTDSQISSDAFRSVASFAAPVLPFTPITVKTWIHVVAGAQTVEEGWIPDSQLAAQMDVLNEDFAPHNINFALQGVTRTVNVNWTNEAPRSEFEMKSALRKGDYKTLNLYFQKYFRGNALGFAYLPNNVTTGSRQFILDGATNRFDSVPGGTATGYNLGKTVTHEVGHWMGLLHTFQGTSCTGPGDMIADTAIHNAPTRGCPVGLDTCPDNEGPDPIHNYMDYSVDACYEEFTPLQAKRMFDMWYRYRDPRTCAADNCLRALRATSIPGRLEESQAFCGDYTKFIVTDVSLIKPYAASACMGNVASRVSSACSCLPTPSA